MTAADFTDIASWSERQRTLRYGSPSFRCCNVLSLLYSLQEHRPSLVTSQVNLSHYGESIAHQLPRGGVRQGCSLGRSRQQRGVERLWEAHRPPFQPAVARHVPQALEPLSSPLERRSAPQTASIAPSPAPHSRKTSCGKLPKCRRAF